MVKIQSGLKFTVPDKRNDNADFVYCIGRIFTDSKGTKKVDITWHEGKSNVYYTYSVAEHYLENNEWVPVEESLPVEDESKLCTCPLADIVNVGCQCGGT